MKLVAPRLRSLARLALAAVPLALGCNAISGLGDLRVVGGGPTTTAITGGSGGSGGSGTTTGGPGGGLATGGAGGAGTGNCSVPANCPGPAHGCSKPTCDAGVCGVEPAPQGTLAADDVAGDCLRRVCDGAGDVTTVHDDLDVPTTGAACAADACEAGAPSHPPKAEGTACSEGAGTKCDGKGACVECTVGADCPGGVCKAGGCVAPGCDDGQQNGAETDIDCGGGACPACVDGKSCGQGSDCASLVCAGVCQAPTCADGAKNGGESDLDCGGPCSPCPSGKACGAHADCLSEACLGGTCAKFVQIAAGSAHACALLDDGSAHCWGANASGQLGDGSTQPHASPQPVKLAAKATRLSLGALQDGDPSVAHACAVIAGGAAACWGANDAGQLGLGKLSAAEATPVEVPGLASVNEIAAGGRHTCSVAGGALLCWGDNARGQLGTNGKGGATSPVVIKDVPSGLKHVAAGSLHTCVTALFNVACTGANASGQLGVGDTNDRLALTAIANNGAAGITAGGNFTSMWGGFGGNSAQSFGDNTTGQLGTGQSPGSHSNPNGIKSISGVQAISAGTRPGSALGGHACATLASGGASCWGDNASGQLGDGTQKGPVGTPAPVPSLKNVAEVAAGGSFTCARLSGGPIRCWGRNDLGQLGRGAASAQPGLTPEAVAWP